MVGALAASREIYRIGMGCSLDELADVWNKAIANPIPPRVVEAAPCHDIVIMGNDLDKPWHALDGIPLPISTPGWDIAPYATLSQYITKDPDTGIQNMGIYRGQLKAPRRLGMNPSLELRPGIYVHWEKMRSRGKKLPAAVVWADRPVSRLCQRKNCREARRTARGRRLGGRADQRCEGEDGRSAGSGRRGDFVEGLIDTEYLEPEAPFGESHGHVNLAGVQCIHGRHLYYAASQRHSYFDHFPGDPE